MDILMWANKTDILTGYEKIRGKKAFPGLYLWELRMCQNSLTS